jgi:hypothetical protein
MEQMNCGIPLTTQSRFPLPLLLLFSSLYFSSLFHLLQVQSRFMAVWLAAAVVPHAASASMLTPATAIVRTRRWMGGIVERFGTMTLLFGSVRRGVEPAPGRQPERSM